MLSQLLCYGYSFRFNYLAWHPFIDVLETAIDLGQQLQCTLSRAQLMCAKFKTPIGGLRVLRPLG